MSNLIGENLDSYVVSQIKTRETILGSANRTNEQIIWENNKNGWVKLVSSANIHSPLSAKYGGGSELAKKYVLFNGVSNGFNNTRAGLDISGPKTNQGAYGLGGPEFGFAPMPGIMSADIKTETRGTLKTGTVQIKANNKEQFEIISTLYIRLGYLMLLEWGHSCYFEDTNTFISDNSATLASGFLKGKLSYHTILSKIEAKRAETKGNYDALCGKVVNYNWKFNKDGSYDITLILRSTGDIIESLKSNLLNPKTQESNQREINLTSGESTSGFDAIDPDRGYISPNSIINAFAYSSVIGNQFAHEMYLFGQEAANRKKNGMQSREGNWGNGIKHIDYVAQEWYVSGKRVDYYVRFGEFLDFLKNNVIPTTDGVPLMNFGDINSTSIVCYKPPRIVPVNPDICIWRQEIQDYIFFPECEPCVFDNKIRLMYVYINFVYVLRCIENLKNDKGELKIIDLLNSICKGFNQSTGNYSKVTARVNLENNQVVFIDENRIPGGDKTTGIFNVYGVQPGVYGSFIRDINLQTAITPELATMITIGSTARGYTTGTDATFLSNLNKGTSARISTDISSPDKEADKESKTDTLYSDAVSLYNDYVGYTSVYYPSGSTNFVEAPVYDATLYQNMPGAMRQLVEYDEQLATRQAAKKDGKYAGSPSTGFLPFNLSLTMDGLSGPKIYSKYSINQSFLPSNYPETMDFIVTGVTNNISNNVWTTTLNSMAVPGYSVVSSPPGKIPEPPTKPPIPNFLGPVNREGCKPFVRKTLALMPNIWPNGQQNDSVWDVQFLRKNIVEIASKYVGQVCLIDENVGQGRIGFCDPAFEQEMVDIGWRQGDHWCNTFAALIYKKAYQSTRVENGLNVVIDKAFGHTFNIAVNKFFNIMNAGVISTVTRYQALQKELSKNGTTASFVWAPYKSDLNKLVPGDVVFWKRGDNTYGHINICVAVDYVARTFQTIGGNEGPGSQVSFTLYKMDNASIAGIAKPIKTNEPVQGTFTIATLESLTGKIEVGSRQYQFYNSEPTT